jgi:hypothetical protein
MTTELETKKPVSMWKHKILAGVITCVMFLVSSVSAVVDLSGVTAIIDDVTLLFPSLVATVIAAIPILIIIGIVAFILGLLDGILKSIK